MKAPPDAEAPATTAQSDVLQELRAVMVDRALWIIVVLAGFVQIMVNIEEVRRGRYGVVAIYVGLYAVIILAATRKSLPFHLRAMAAPTVLYLVAAIELWLYTIVSNASLYLFSFVILTGIFIGFRAGLIALAVSVCTLVIAAWLYLAGHLPAEPQPPHLLLTRPEMSEDIVNWLSIGIPFVFVCGSILACLTAMLRALITKTEVAEKLIEDLKRENEERHAATLERGKALEALQKSEVRFRELTELLPVAVFETDERMSLTYANRCAFEMFGYQEVDLSASPPAPKLIAESELKRVQDDFSRRLRGEDIGILKYSALRKDGTTFPILLHMGPIIHRGS
jgi:PAS domain S-box-containing protein